MKTKSELVFRQLMPIQSLLNNRHAAKRTNAGTTCQARISVVGKWYG